MASSRSKSTLLLPAYVTMADGTRRRIAAQSIVVDIGGGIELEIPLRRASDGSITVRTERRHARAREREGLVPDSVEVVFATCDALRIFVDRVDRKEDEPRSSRR